jgi:hypothetical protein
LAIAEVHITGLRELRAALRRVDGSILGELREGLKDAANIVSDDARSQINSRSGKAAASIRAVSGGNTIYIKGGGARVPYYGWLEFGGTLPTKRPSKKKALFWSGASHPSKRARGARRDKVAEGRYIRPTVERNVPRLVEAAADAFDSARQKAGL